MMSFSVRVSDYQKNPMLNICDANILGKVISENELKINISKSYYGEKIVDEAEAAELLKKSTIINMAGEKTVSLSIKLGIGSEIGVKKVNDVPFLIVFKM